MAVSGNYLPIVLHHNLVFQMASPAFHCGTVCVLQAISFIACCRTTSSVFVWWLVLCREFVGSLFWLIVAHYSTGGFVLLRFGRLFYYRGVFGCAVTLFFPVALLGVLVFNAHFIFVVVVAFDVTFVAWVAKVFLGEVVFGVFLSAFSGLLFSFVFSRFGLCIVLG